MYAPKSENFNPLYSDGFKFSHAKYVIALLGVQNMVYSKTCLKRPLKNKQNKVLNGKW